MDSERSGPARYAEATNLEQIWTPTTADPLAGREVQWPRPPAQGYVAEDLDRIADLPLHTQLIDGSLVVASPQREFHMLVVTLLENGLRRSCPAPLRVRREMTVTLSSSQRPEPDLLIVRARQRVAPSHVVFRRWRRIGRRSVVARLGGARS